MPRGFIKHGIKHFTRTRGISKGIRRRLFTKGNKTKRTPRRVIRTAPSSSPNVYMFKRSYDYPFTVGHPDTDHEVYVNPTNHYMVIKLRTKFNELPDYDEFKHLFSEYKITSITHKLVPYYRNNMATTLAPSAQGAYGIAIPNYEVFAIPVTTSVKAAHFEALTTAEIDSFLNQTQRKGKRMMPNRTATFHTKRPKVVGYKGPVDKSGGVSLATMVAPSYYSTDSAAQITGGPDQTAVAHYGIQLLIRRVDGLQLNDYGHQNNVVQHMGFRMETDVYFKTRKVQ